MTADPRGAGLPVFAAVARVVRLRSVRQLCTGDAHSAHD